MVSTNSVEYVIHRQQSQNQFYDEVLADYVALRMMVLPKGIFHMGAPKRENESRTYEKPQREVSVATFSLGKYPVTQAQWKAVASLPKITKKLNPEPSQFKGDDRPVERISWYEAEEFCERLSQHTGRPYRLPSEAEWEYACRAGTTTPFHFGETITPELANYNSRESYAGSPTQERIGETTPVGQYGIANAYGLSDMHGNVLEWCADHWHENYEGAPSDGSAWLTDKDSTERVFRGGSWYINPRNCRSAYRYYFAPDAQFINLGFRVACSAPRTP